MTVLVILRKKSWGWSISFVYIPIELIFMYRIIQKLYIVQHPPYCTTPYYLLQTRLD